MGSPACKAAPHSSNWTVVMETNSEDVFYGLNELWKIIVSKTVPVSKLFFPFHSIVQ